MHDVRVKRVFQVNWRNSSSISQSKFTNSHFSEKYDQCKNHNAFFGGNFKGLRNFLVYCHG